MTDTWALVTLGVGTGSAAAIDLATRRIPNLLSASLAVAGLTLALTGTSGVTPASSTLGMVVGLALMLPGHVFGATGAGDVKLFAAAGAVLGAGRMLPAFAYVAIAGGALAVAIACGRGRLAPTLARAGGLVGLAPRVDVRAEPGRQTLAYGPAIAIGCVAAALW
ncbi:MAG: prepilin peptidase [Acidimicrobiia bacterium]|nr:prepilin peptidase [Acidimicrobiia bacterium]